LINILYGFVSFGFFPRQSHGFTEVKKKSFKNPLASVIIPTVFRKKSEGPKSGAKKLHFEVIFNF
jgi:hypothetical protein